MESYCFSNPGEYHRERNMDNEDCVIILENDELVVSVITDGAGGKRAGKKAAQLLAPAIAKWIRENFLELYYKNGDLVRGEAIRIINACLKPYAQSHGYEETDLACTLMAAAIDSEGRCLCIHLGDGIILRQNDKYCGDVAEVISPPEKGASLGSTFLTMNCNMWRHIHYCRWRTQKYDHIIMMTDGASDHIADLRGMDGWSIKVPCQLDAKSIVNYLKDQHPVDDYSFALISNKSGHPNMPMVS